MNVLENFPDSSRIWIYTAPRPLTIEECEFISARMANFVAEWAAHGAKLNADFEILYKRFIVIAVDEGPQNATGCSIDSCVHELQKIGTELNIDFFDRMVVVYRDEENNNMVVSCKMNELKNMIADGDFTPQTIVFDNTILTLGELRSRWENTAGNTWMKRYFSAVKS